VQAFAETEAFIETRRLGVARGFDMLKRKVITAYPIVSSSFGDECGSKIFVLKEVRKEDSAAAQSSVCPDSA